MTRLDQAPPRFSPSTAPVPPQLRLDVSYRFGLKMRELRHNRNWTQQQMANLLGIDRSYISEVERGRKSISLPMLEVVALGFGIPLSDLLADIRFPLRIPTPGSLGRACRTLGQNQSCCKVEPQDR